MLYVFNNNSYTDLKTASKYVLVPGYAIQVN